MAYIRHILIGLCVFTVALLVMIGTREDKTPAAPKLAPKAPTPLRVTSTDLYEKHGEYSGAFVQVAGRITQLGRDRTGKYLIVLGTSFDNQQSSRYQTCIVDDLGEMSSIPRGTSVNVTGTVAGRMEDNSVLLVNCKLTR
jgi:hypothetical protein